MLVLTRSNENPSILIGDDIVVHVRVTSSGQVKVGIEAPEDVEILREELAVKSTMDAQ